MDPNDLNGNFINPDYATPEQVAQMRAYADMLQKGATADTSKSWTGVLAQALMGLGGARSMGNANQMQRQILQQGSNAIQGVGQVNPAAGVITGQNPTMPQASNIPASGGNNALKAAILMQESGNNSNVGNSSAGAIGPGQIMPNTFASVARPGENINNPNDNRAVSARLLDQYEQKYGGDPARAAVAYYSGEGNVAPPGSQTPWIRDITKDRAGNPIKPVSSYVADVTRRMGGGGQQMAQNNPMATFMMTPGIPPELKQRVMDLNTPTPKEDVAGQPGAQLGVMGPTVRTGVGNGWMGGPGAPVGLSPGNITAGAGTLRALPGLLGGQQGQPGQPGNTLGALKPLQDELIDQGARKAGADVEASKTAAMLGEFKGEGVQAKTLSGQLDTLKQLGSKVGYGLGPAMQNRMAELGIYTPGVSEIQAYQNFIPYVGVLLRPEGSGRLMSQELSQFNQALGGLMVTPEGRATAMESLSRIAHYRTKIANIANDDKVSQNDRMKQINELPLPQLNWSEIKRYSNQNTNQPSAAHIDALKKNPMRREEFNMKFGNGAADKVLGPQ